MSTLMSRRLHANKARDLSADDLATGNARKPSTLKAACQSRLRLRTAGWSRIGERVDLISSACLGARSLLLLFCFLSPSPFSRSVVVGSFARCLKEGRLIRRFPRSPVSCIFWSGVPRQMDRAGMRV